MHIYYSYVCHGPVRQLTWHFPALFTYVFTKTSSQSITSGPSHSGWDHSHTKMCTRIKQTNSICLHIPTRKLFSFQSSNFCRSHLLWTYPLGSGRVNCSTRPSLLCTPPMEELPVLELTGLVKTRNGLRVPACLIPCYVPLYIHDKLRNRLEDSATKEKNCKIQLRVNQNWCSEALVNPKEFLGPEIKYSVSFLDCFLTFTLLRWVKLEKKKSFQNENWKALLQRCLKKVLEKKNNKKITGSSAKNSCQIQHRFSNSFSGPLETLVC